MKIVTHTEVGKYYIAYWMTHIVKVIAIFKQDKEPFNGGRTRVDDEHLVYITLNSWRDMSVDEISMVAMVYSSLSLYDLRGAEKAIIYELDNDEITHHIIMESI